MQKIVSCSLSPNTEAEDVIEAIRVLTRPASWQKGEAVGAVERWFGGVSFDSGRTALLALLHAFGIGSGDEVLLQAFTCVAVPNSIHSAGATPVYVDIDDTFNMDPKDASRKITSHTKAIIVQHTFGVPAQMDEILSLARKYNIVLIEDCAHSLGAMYKGKRIGTLGDVAFYSFGRDKVISSIWGGMATINDKCQMTNAKLKLKEIQERLPYPSAAWIAQQLQHPIAFSLILPTYNVILGKVILEAMKQMKLLSLPNPPSVTPRRYPNALAQLLMKQLAKLDRYNAQRRRIASYYQHTLNAKPLDSGAIYLRYPILVDDSARMIKEAKQRGILLGNWYHDILDATCRSAVEVSRKIINLPTLINEEAARRVVDAIQLD